MGCVRLGTSKRAVEVRTDVDMCVSGRLGGKGGSRACMEGCGIEES